VLANFQTQVLVLGLGGILRDQGELSSHSEVDGEDPVAREVDQEILGTSSQSENPSVGQAPEPDAIQRFAEVGAMDGDVAEASADEGLD
jgi:hypothetical protein